VIPGGLVVSYLGEKLLYKRGGNDSFREHGIIARLQISVEGLAHIANTIFGRNSQEAFHIRRVIRNEWPLRALMSIKRLTAMSAKKENIKVLNEIVSKHYSNAGIENKCKYVFFRLIPISVLKLAVSAKNTLIKHCVFYL
jgi:abequosyltransferase